MSSIISNTTTTATTNANANDDNDNLVNSSNINTNDVLIDPYPIVDLSSSSSSLNKNNNIDHDNNDDDDSDDDDDRCTVISVPVGNVLLKSSQLQQQQQPSSMKTFVTNNNYHNNNNNCDQNNDGDNQCNNNNNNDHVDNDDDDEIDDADRTLKSNQQKNIDPNDRFYHHHPHYNNNKNKNFKNFIDININDNDDGNNKTNDKKMTTFTINGPHSTSTTTTTNSINNENDQHKFNVIKNGDPLDSTLLSSLMATSSSSSSSSKQPETPPIFFDSDVNLLQQQQQTETPSSSDLSSSTATTISSRIMPQLNDEQTTTTTISKPEISSSLIEQNINQTSSNNYQTYGEPFAILSKKENSCHFIERRISLAKQAKVGRSIGKTLSSLNNAVFDCKVLSRNHAVLWYQDGKFYLKDTCSSNGTFVNGQRLSATNERSLPQIIYSGDLIQFGVEVTEKKNVHSCVIATIRLFHPDGSEATKDNNDRLLLNDGCFVDDEQQFLLNYPNSSIQIPPSQLIDLVCQIHQSKRKQTLLEQQIDSTKQLMKEALDSAKNGWRSLVEEDRYLSRIQVLQAQLEVCLIARNNDSPESLIIETLKQNNLKLIADKEKFELETKYSLQKAIENKIITETNLQAIQIKLDKKTNECLLLKESLDKVIKELKCLIQNCDKLKIEKDELLNKIKCLEDDNVNVNVKNDEKMIKQINKSTTNHQQQQLNSTKKTSSTSTNTEIKILLDQLIQTTSDNDMKLIEKQHQQIQTDEIDSTNQQQKIEILLENLNDKIKQNEQIMIEQLKFIENFFIEKLIKFNNNTNENVQLLKEKFIKILKNLKLLSINYKILKEKYLNETLMNKSLLCDIDDLKNKLQQQQNEKIEKSIQIDQQISTDNNIDDGNKQSTMLSLLKTLNFDDDDDDDESDSSENIDEIIKEKFEKLLEQNKTLTSINDCLNDEIKLLKDKHLWLSIQNQVSFSIAVLPLFIIFICFILILYQPLSFIMATFGH